MNQQIAAFFDIDGTIYREGLITEVFKKMVTHEIISESRYTDEVEPAFKAWDFRQGNYDEYLDSMIEIFKETTIGISREHINLIAKRVVEQKGDRVYQFSRRQIELHRELGHKIIAISGSPDALVREMAIKYSFDDWRATKYITDENGCYTGDIVPMWDAVSKEKAIDELAFIYNLDLNKCFSYGDTNGDFKMFIKTGYSTAVNPTSELIENILNNEDLKKKINIIVERKDVIYEMDINNLNIINLVK